MIDLDTLSLDELKRLKKDVDKAISGFESKKKKEALVALEAKAAELGFSLSDLTNGTKKISVPKYRNPENADETWTGRGRQPEWYKSAISGGKSPEDLRI